MNLRTKFIVISAGLAAFAQAQDLQSDTAVATDTAAVSTPVADITTIASEAATPVEADSAAANVAAPETAETMGTPTDVAAEIPADAATADSAVAANSAQDSIAPASQPVADTLAKVEPVADSAAVDTLAKVEEVPAADSIVAPASATAPANESKAAHPLDIVHGNAYNMVGNEAASATIGSDLAMPHKMFGHKLGYFEPIEGYGVASFGSSNTYFIAFDNSQNLGLLTAGISNGRFGAALKVSLGKNWNTIHNDIDNSENKVSTTSSGSLIGAVASTKIHNLELGIDVAYANNEEQSLATTPNAKIEVSNWDAGGKITVADYSNSRFVWAASVNVLRHQAKTRTKTITYFIGEDDKDYVATFKSVISDTSSRVEVVPQINVASTVLESPMARLHIGLNTTIPMIAYDVISGIVSRHNEYGLQFVPNILGEVNLNKYAMAFGSASYQWDAVAISDFKKGNIDTKNTKTESGTTTANIGMRLHTDFAALELTFTKQFLQNPFGSFSNTDEIGVSLGAFVLF